MRFRKGTILITVGLLLMAAAFLLTAYNIWDDYRTGVGTDEILVELRAEVSEDPAPAEGRPVFEDADPLPDDVEYPDYILNPNKELPEKEIDGKKYVGILRIPTLDKELPIFGEWSYYNLKYSPCRFDGTPYQHNMVICAHNYNVHFGQIKNLKVDDIVSFTDMDGNVFQYRVVEIESLEPAAVEEMVTGEWDLTLFTCTLGGSTRITVRCVVA